MLSFAFSKKSLAEKSLTAHNTDVGYPTYLQINHSVAKHFHFWCQAYYTISTMYIFSTSTNSKINEKVGFTS